jgi:hypothetical protein
MAGTCLPPVTKRLVTSTINGGHFLQQFNQKPLQIKEGIKNQSQNLAPPSLITLHNAKSTKRNEHMNKFTIEQTMTVLMTMNLSLEEKLRYHLARNFNKPLPKSFVKPCLQAIMLDSYGFDWDSTLIELPPETKYHGSNQAPMGAIIKGHYLEWFLKDTEDNGRIMSEVGFSIEFDSPSKPVIDETQQQKEQGERE